MGTTAEKGARVLQSIAEVQEGINNLGGSLTDQTPFKDFKAQLDEIYDNLPKTEFQEGTEVTIEGGLKGKIDFDDGKVGFGQASQESTQGYNLLPFPVATSGVVSGVTHSSQNGVYTMKGTSTATSTRLDYNIEGYTIKSGDYLHLLSNITSNNCSFALLESSTSQITFVSPTSTERIVDLSSFAGKTITVVRTFFNGTTIDITMKPMITNSNQSQQFEKYTGGYASPSPNWEQPIQCVTGNQEIVESDGNNNSITYPISLGNNKFYSIGDYADELVYDVVNDKVYKKAYIGMTEITSSSSIVYDTSLTSVSRFRTTINNVVNATDSGKAYCNYFTLVNGFSLDSEHFYIYGTANNKTMYFFINNDIASSLAELQTWLANRTIKVYYILLTPTLTELTDTTLKQQVKNWYYSQSYTGTTIIESNGDLPMIIKVRALKGE